VAVVAVLKLSGCHHHVLSPAHFCLTANLPESARVVLILNDSNRTTTPEVLGIAFPLGLGKDCPATAKK
jgi:hypothetical protein